LPPFSHHAIKKADVIERQKAFHHVGLLDNEPPGMGRAALYLVIRRLLTCETRPSGIQSTGSDPRLYNLELGNTRKFFLLCPDRSGFPKILPFPPISGQLCCWEYSELFHCLAVERHDLLNWTTLFRAWGFDKARREALSVERQFDDH
jgi:hypothetical protein